jgi:hypothetical protein
MDGSVGNILQAQLTMNGSTYILGWVHRKYYSNTIDKEWFNIYSGMNGSVGNIIQTQLTINGSTYILGWMVL